jgi:hypothetical protein
MNSRNESRLERAALLLAAIKDIAPPGHPQPIPLAEASRQFRESFEQYLVELRRSNGRAEQWFNGLVMGIMERTGKSRDEAIRAALASSPVAPTSHTAVIGTIRTYWLRCAQLNSTVPRAMRVPPEQFVLGWLIEASADDLVTLLSRLTYFPVGLDKNGQWI